MQVSEAEGHRAIVLTLRVGELLLSSGEATERVGDAMRRIIATYGLRHVEVDVNLSALTVSQVPENGRPATTAERRVRRRSPDYDRLIAVHRLVEEIAAKELSLTETDERIQRISRRGPRYPRWATVCALALVATSAAVLVGGGPAVAAAAFTATVLGNLASSWLVRHGAAEFFGIAVAASFGAALAVLLISQGFRVTASAVVVGAVVALLPGRPLVACVQDGFAGEYVTATARLAEILFVVTAVVSGIGITLAIAVQAGVRISVANVPSAPLTLEFPQLLGALSISLTFGVAMLVPPRHLLPGAIGGLLIWTTFVLLRTAELPGMIAVAISSTLVGAAGAEYARLVKVPALVFVIPSIGPLLPGSMFYRGMLETILNDPTTGTLHLVEAMSVALSLGAGVILGGEITRAVHHPDPTDHYRRFPSRG